MCIQGSGDYRRVSDVRPYPHAGEHTAEDECVKFDGIFEREKRSDDI